MSIKTVGKADSEEDLIKLRFTFARYGYLPAKLKITKPVFGDPYFWQ